MLLSDTRPNIYEKLGYLVNLVCTLGPVAYIMNGLGFWFETNHQFSAFVIFCLMINMVVGIWYHKTMNSFKWELFLMKNCKMWVILIITYALLEMLRLTAGDNLVSDGFRVFIQITTLIYPISKALKNLYILSQKQFPPAFIMEKIYNFEKTGNLSNLFETNNKLDEN